MAILEAGPHAPVNSPRAMLDGSPASGLNTGMGMDIGKEMDAFRRALREQGLSCTNQRLKLAEIVFTHHQHFTADDLISWARKSIRGGGRVTVYRTLKVMADAGLIGGRPFRLDRVGYEPVIGRPARPARRLQRSGRFDFGGRGRGLALLLGDGRLLGIVAVAVRGGGDDGRRSLGGGRSLRSRKGGRRGRRFSARDRRGNFIGIPASPRLVHPGDAMSIVRARLPVRVGP